MLLAALVIEGGLRPEDRCPYIDVRRGTIICQLPIRSLY